MKRILITGARAPAALELARLLAPSARIFMADSVSKPLSRASNAVRRYYTIPSPVSDLQAYKTALIRIIKKNDIDLLLPTCEEIFFISFLAPELSKYCRLFCMDFDTLHKLHHKYNFLQAAEGCGMDIPDTFLLQANAHKKPFQAVSRKFVFKPVYSRFATHTLVCPTAQQLEMMNPTIPVPWVAQKFIRGKEYCTYSIAVKGKLQAHSCYHSKYRAGIGSGIYFEPINDNRITDFVRNFVKKHRFTGQLGFDIIEDAAGQLFVIECNPRATSGIHLFAGNTEFNDVLEGECPEVVLPFHSSPRMVMLAMLTFGLSSLSPAFMRDIWAAKDVAFNRRDPYPAFYQCLGLAEIILKSFKSSAPLTATATADIEWNGQPL